MTTYTVRATRWAEGWELDVDGVGVTQSHALDDAELMVRDYIAVTRGDIAPDPFALRVVVGANGPAVEAVVSQDDGRWVADVPAVDIRTSAATFEELDAQVREAIATGLRRVGADQQVSYVLAQ